MASTFDRNQVLAELVTKMAMDPKLINQFEKLYLPEERDRFTSALQELIPQAYRPKFKDVYAAFTTYCKWVVPKVCDIPSLTYLAVGRIAVPFHQP